MQVEILHVSNKMRRSLTLFVIPDLIGDRSMESTFLLSSPRKQDRRIVTRAMQDMQHIHRPRADAVEDQVIAMHAVAHAFGLVTRHQRKPLGKVCQPKAGRPQLTGKAQRPLQDSF